MNMRQYEDILLETFEMCTLVEAVTLAKETMILFSDLT